MKGSLQKKNGTYYAVFTVLENGRKKQKWVSTHLKEGVEEHILKQKLEEILILNSNYSNKNYSKMAGENFGDYYMIWLGIKKMKIEPSTFENYQKYGKKIFAYFKQKGVALGTLMPIDIESFYSYLLQKGICKNTIRHIHVTLHQCVEYAVKNDWLVYNPINKVEKPKESITKRQFYNVNEMKDLFNLIKNEELKLPIMLSAIYGLRRSEALGLKWSAIDFENKKIAIEHKVIQVKINGKYVLYKSNTLKTKSSNRELPLTTQVDAILREKQQEIERNKKMLGNEYNNFDNEYVCVDNMGNLITPSRLTHGFNDIQKKYNLKHIRFHDLRHSCASIMVAQNVSMKQIQEWLGHSNFSTTANIYSHLDFKSKINSAKMVSNAFSFINQTYNINQEILPESESITEEELITKIKKYQRMLKKLRKTNKI